MKRAAVSAAEETQTIPLNRPKERTMRLLAITVATCAALTVGADAAQAGDTSGHHQVTMAVMGSGHVAQATLVRHGGYRSRCGSQGGYYGRGPVVVQRHYSSYPTSIYRSYGSYGYPHHGRSYHSYGHHGRSSGGFYYGGSRFGISIGF